MRTILVDFPGDGLSERYDHLVAKPLVALTPPSPPALPSVLNDKPFARPHNQQHGSSPSRASAMDIAFHVFGAAGLASTVVELLYVLTNRDRFTRFEEVFFFTSASFEVAAEAIFLGWLVYKISRDLDVTFISMFGVITKDPVANLGVSRVTTRTKRAGDEAYVCYPIVLFSIIPLLAWATFLPVWVSSFDGDEGIRLALSIASIVGTLTLLFSFYLVAMAVANPWSGGEPLFSYGIAMTIHLMIKTFEVSILLSHWERLCSSDLGKSLIVLLAMEVPLVALFWGCVCRDL